MTTECNATYLDFPMLGSREVFADFNGGDVSSDGGALLLRETERLTGIIRQFAACFTDHRNPDLTEHTVEELVAQRVYALALGYEDLNDHDLRRDPLLATVVGKGDPTGETRRRTRDRGRAPAGKSTLNRLELTPVGADKRNRYLDCGQHLHGSPEACRLHCRAWILPANFAPWHPAATRDNEGWHCPAERPNRHRHHDDWL